MHRKTKTTTTTMKAINTRKQWFATKREAVAAYEQRKGIASIGVYRQREGRHKGQYFVGTYLEFINRY